MDHPDLEGRAGPRNNNKGSRHKPERCARCTPPSDGGGVQRISDILAPVNATEGSTHPAAANTHHSEVDGDKPGSDR